MRYAAVIGLMLVIVSCATRKPPQTSLPDDVRARPVVDRNVFCFVDGRTASCDDFQRYAPESIERIEVLKGAAAAARYGPDAEGAILVSTKSPPDAPRPAGDPAEPAFYFIDGRTASRVDLERLPRDAIDRIEVLKNVAAVTRYGSAAVPESFTLRQSVVADS
ncbi:MAG: TonB-dependent receptor plug domain-containing protein [Gemmatimonadetes bacterium]|nr:TonB-dependent receptor plug domain-containing protein [Gemmatimonadota bacterium]